MKGSNKMPTKSGKNLKNYALGLTLHSEEDVKVKVVLNRTFPMSLTIQIARF